MMNNYAIRHSWNNHKDMGQKELVEKFLKLPLYGKIQVYRTLGAGRKTVLRKGYDKYKQEKQQEKQQQIEEEHKEALYKKSETTLSPLAGLLDFMDIATDDILKLTYAIIIKDCYAGYYDSYDPNSNKEEDSFNSIKEKMMAHIKRNEARDKMGEHSQTEIQKISDYYDNLLYFLDDLKYTPGQKINYSLIPKTDKWKRMYKHLGVTIKLSDNIIKALFNFIENGGLSNKHAKWQKQKKQKDFHWQALDTYNRADIATQDIDYLR